MQDVFTALLEQKKNESKRSFDFLKRKNDPFIAENWRLFLEQKFSNLKDLNLSKKKSGLETACFDGFFNLTEDFSWKEFSRFIFDDHNFDFSLFQINPFIEANLFFSAETLDIVLPKGKRLAPLDLSFFMSQKSVFATPRMRVIVSENSQATIKITRQQCQNLDSYQNSFFNFILEEGATLTLECMDDNLGYDLTESIFVEQKKASSFYFKSFTHGCDTCCRDIQIVISGEDCKTDLKSVALLKNDERMFSHSHLNHHEKGAFAQQSFRSVLGDRAFCEYNGLVTIQPKAHGCDSSQSNMNLLLSDNARVYTRPQLKIDADDVSCGHGATIGQVDDEQVYYLQTRGLSKSEASLLLLKGFIIEGLDGFSLVEDSSFLKKLDTLLLNYVC